MSMAGDKPTQHGRSSKGRVLKLSELSKSQLQPWIPHDLDAKVDLSPVLAELRRAVQTAPLEPGENQGTMGNTRPGEEESPALKGRIVPVCMRASLVTDESGRIVRLAGIRAVVDTLGCTEQALRASEEQYRRLVETANEGIWFSDAHGVTVFVNGKMA